MEGKDVSALIMALLILGLVVAQIEAATCCGTIIDRSCYDYCLSWGDKPSPVCARDCGCIIVPGHCRRSHLHSSMLENSGATINEYCKLGCASSVCDTITTSQMNTDVGEGEVNEAMEHCVDACSELCNKGAMSALASA